MNQARFFHPRNTSWQSEGKSDTHNRVGEASKHEEGKETGENTEKTEFIPILDESARLHSSFKTVAGLKR